MILFRCPRCGEYMVVTDVRAVRNADSVLCPHCNRTSTVKELSNKPTEEGVTEQCINELTHFAETISNGNVNEGIARICQDFHIAPEIAAYIANCLLGRHTPIDYPPLFVEYEPLQKINLENTFERFEREIRENQHQEPHISLAAHLADAKELEYQRTIQSLEEKLNNVQEELDGTHNKVVGLTQQMDNQREEIRKLKDKIVFLQGNF